MWVTTALLLLEAVCMTQSRETIGVSQEVLYDEASPGVSEVPVRLVSSFNMSFEEHFLMSDMQCDWDFGDGYGTHTRARARALPFGLTSLDIA